MKRTRQERTRLGILVMLVGLFTVTVVVRLVHLQIFESARYSEIVIIQSSGTVGIPAERGRIYDRRGKVVAENVRTPSLYAYPAAAWQVSEAASYVEKLFGLPSGMATKKYGLQPRRFRWIDRTMDDRLAARVIEDNPDGLYLREESERIYPFGQVGKQILGFTDIDNIGRSGLEMACDSLLAGDSGIADIRRDGKSTIYRVQENALIKPVPGKSLVLTIDWRLQDIVESELAAAVEKYNARDGMAAFLDCNNGDILAIAHFDPNEQYPDKPTKLRAITDWFEPGSSFKPFVAAGLLDAGEVDFQDSTYCEKGAWDTGGRTLHDDKELEWLSFREIIEKSSNIGIGKHAFNLGGDEVFEAVKRFGFGDKLRCGLPGEAGGRLVKPNRWTEYTTSVLAMGHGVAVTTLQMANAFAAIANGGTLLRPRVVLGYVDADGRLISHRDPDVIGRAMMESSVDSLQSFMRGVVEHGTATDVNSDVITIAGKTGTAELVDTETGHIIKNRFMASFGGFFPVDKPKIAGFVVLRDPRPITYGGHTSGPAFRKIAERYLVVNPDLFSVPERQLVEHDRDDEQTVDTPDLIGRDVNLARTMAGDRGLKLRASAAEGTVVWQFPPADRLVFQGDEVFVHIQPTGNENDVPDLTGLDVRTASAYLHFRGVGFRITGTGHVVRQTPDPGDRESEKQLWLLTCRPG